MRNDFFSSDLCICLKWSIALYSNDTLTALQGRFEIISLSGSFLLSESNGNRSRSGGLSISLAGPDGKVLGGGVAGMLTAASPVQVQINRALSFQVNYHVFVY